MFFAILFLTAAALGSYFFPDWSSAAILISAFAVVASLRLILWLTSRGKSGTD